MKVQIGKFYKPFEVFYGDTINLHHNKRLVCSKNITCCERVSRWAHVLIPGQTEGYFIGDDNLSDVMRNLFPQATIEEI